MLRPLAGLTIIEFEGIGPGPLAGRMLADHGAEVTAIVRPMKAAIGNPEFDRRRGPAAARQAGRRARPQAPGGGRGGADADRRRGRADRGQPARRDGAARPRPRRMRAAEPETRLRAHDRVGPGRPAGAFSRPRPQLCGVDRRAVADRAPRSGADPAADGARRRRRRARARLRNRQRRFVGAGDGQRLRGGRRDHRHGRGLERHRALGAFNPHARRRPAEHVPRFAVLRRLPLR